MSDKDREAFEVWCSACRFGFQFTRGIHGQIYDNPTTQDMWTSWQAARDHFASKPKSTFTEWLGRFMEPYNVALKEYARAIRTKPLYGKIEPEDALNSALQSFARWFYENPQAWQQDVDPQKMTEEDIEKGARIMAENAAHLSFDHMSRLGKDKWMLDFRKALCAAGVRFKEEA